MFSIKNKEIGEVVKAVPDFPVAQEIETALSKVVGRIVSKQEIFATFVVCVSVFIRIIIN